MSEPTKGNTKALEVNGEESYVSKLSMKSLGCKPKVILAPDAKDKIALCRIYGIAESVEFQPDVDKGGNAGWTFFKGQFEGINMQDGTVARSGKLFLPSGVSEIMEDVVRKSKERDKANEISFAFEIRVIKATNKAGYSYEATALKDPAEEDALAGMRQLVLKAPTMEQKQAAKLAGAPAGTTVIEGQQTQRKAS